MPNGSDCIASHPLQEIQPTKSVGEPEMEAWLPLGMKTKKKSGGKKKKKCRVFIVGAVVTFVY